jgi:hypothetical protein
MRAGERGCNQLIMSNIIYVYNRLLVRKGMTTSTYHSNSRYLFSDSNIFGSAEKMIPNHIVFLAHIGNSFSLLTIRVFGCQIRSICKVQLNV